MWNCSNDCNTDSCTIPTLLFSNLGTAAGPVLFFCCCCCFFLFFVCFFPFVLFFFFVVVVVFFILLTFTTLLAKSANEKLVTFSFFFQKTGFDIPMETICKKCEILFSGENVSKCHLLQILPRVLSVKGKNRLPEGTSLFHYEWSQGERELMFSMITCYFPWRCNASLLECKLYLNWKKKLWNICAQFSGIASLRWKEHSHKTNGRNTESESCRTRKQLTFLILSIICLFVLRFYGPVNPMGSCRARSVYLTTRLLGRLSPLSG